MLKFLSFKLGCSSLKSNLSLDLCRYKLRISKKFNMCVGNLTLLTQSDVWIYIDI